MNEVDSAVGQYRNWLVDLDDSGVPLVPLRRLIRTIRVDIRNGTSSVTCDTINQQGVTNAVITPLAQGVQFGNYTTTAPINSYYLIRFSRTTENGSITQNIRTIFSN